jgi:homoserine kinase
MKFKVFSPATIGNVSSGFDILGLALSDLGDWFHFSESNTTEIMVRGADSHLIPLAADQNALTISACKYFSNCSHKNIDFTVTMIRQLPLSGGLGSSAAASVAGALAAATFLRHDPSLPETKLEIMKAALAGESKVSGRHLDNIAPCLLGGLTLVQDIDHFQVLPLPLKFDSWITVASPPLKLQTKDSRKVLALNLPTEIWTKQMAHCTSLVMGMTTGNPEAIRFGLIDLFAEPARSQLIPGFLEAKKLALQAGALGFSISGSGPSCFALSPTKEIAVTIARDLGKIWGNELKTVVCQPTQKGAEVFYE